MTSRLRVEITQGNVDERLRSTELQLRVVNCVLDYKSLTLGTD